MLENMMPLQADQGEQDDVYEMKLSPELAERFAAVAGDEGIMRAGFNCFSTSCGSLPI
jgi:hypothetical protein